MLKNLKMISLSLLILATISLPAFAQFERLKKTDNLTTIQTNQLKILNIILKESFQRIDPWGLNHFQIFSLALETQSVKEGVERGYRTLFSYMDKSGIKAECTLYQVLLYARYELSEIIQRVAQDNGFTLTISQIELVLKNFEDEFFWKNK